MLQLGVLSVRAGQLQSFGVMCRRLHDGEIHVFVLLQIMYLFQ